MFAPGSANCKSQCTRLKGSDPLSRRDLRGLTPTCRTCRRCPPARGRRGPRSLGGLPADGRRRRCRSGSSPPSRPSRCGASASGSSRARRTQSSGVCITWLKFTACSLYCPGDADEPARRRLRPNELTARVRGGEVAVAGTCHGVSRCDRVARCGGGGGQCERAEECAQERAGAASLHLIRQYARPLAFRKRSGHLRFGGLRRPGSKQAGHHARQAGADHDCEHHVREAHGIEAPKRHRAERVACKDAYKQRPQRSEVDRVHALPGHD